MKPRSTEAGNATALLREGIRLGLHDPSQGRAELRRAAALCAAVGDTRGQQLACCAQVLFIGLADDDYTGFEAAVAVAAGAGAGTGGDTFADPGDALLAEAGTLVARSFVALDAPGLAERAAGIESRLADATLPAALRCAGGVAALAYHRIGMRLEHVLWLELAMRPLLANPALSQRLADEVAHMFVLALHECEAPAQALAVRQRHFGPGRAQLPTIALKLALLDAQVALGAGRAADIELGRAALMRAEPLLEAHAPRPAAWWHLLRSRLCLLDGHHRHALTHARLGLRLSTESHVPERWMGVGVMQEGHVQMALGQHLAAVPFFERAGSAATGSQARFCWCLAHLARALHAFEQHDTTAGTTELAAGLAMARELAWLHFLRAGPAVAAQVCALALEHGIETAFVHEAIVARGLQTVRADLQQWPWPIRVRAFGGLRVEIDGQALAFKGKVAKKPLELLLFLVASGGVDVPLSGIAYALWRDLEGDKARAALNVALFRLRKLLGRDEAVVLEHGRLSLDGRLVWVDCLAFEQLADSVGLPASAAALDAAARQAAERALALHTGAFLQGAQDEPWQSLYGARLASKFKRMVTLLARAALARGDGAAARALLERGLESDPLAEDLARDLMRELIHNGEQAQALRVFDRLRLAIAQVLGAKPAPATLDMVQPLRGSAPP